MGAGDGSDRFGYWAAALARTPDTNTNPATNTPTNTNTHREVLTPTLDRPVQIIDVEDLAAWLVTAAAAHTVGPVNAVGPVVTLGEVLTELANAANPDAVLREASDDWLQSQGVNYWAGPRSLPLWVPATDVSMLARSGVRFLATGGTHHSLAEIAESVLQDERQRGLTRDRRAGLTLPEEVDLLASLQGI